MESRASQRKLEVARGPDHSSGVSSGNELLLGLVLGVAAGATAALVVSGLVKRMRKGRLRLLEMEAPDMATVVGEVPSLLSEALEAIEAGTEAVGEIVERTAGMTKRFYQTVGEMKGTVFDYETAEQEEVELPNIDENRIYRDNPPTSQPEEES